MLGAVAIAIVNYRTPDLVGDCLDALGDLAAYAEVVVVDNASGDGSPDIIERRHPAARVVRRSDNGGFAAGVNAAFAATSAPVVVLLNPDTLPAPAAIAALADHLDVHPGCGVAAPMLEHRDGSPQPSAYRRFPGTAIMALELCAPLGFVVERVAGDRHPYRAAAAAGDHRAVPVAHVIGAVLAIRRSAYEAAGPFDEGFFLYLEETEWQRRVGRAGFTVEILPATRVVHLVRGGDGAELAPSPPFPPECGALDDARRDLSPRRTDGRRSRAPRLARRLPGVRADDARPSRAAPQPCPRVRRPLEASPACWRPQWASSSAVTSGEHSRSTSAMTRSSGHVHH
ncbi:glycosyltransferase [Conexibacter sp. W3-3-2]|uniref:glycosyltransferase n=1 Tax=Conexibacter sp. W3-3-2 TaxID=2675227 RepID=UPI0012B6E6D2|nr:glycosyltransferase [Conexibacter sp. W3-3-2]MTD46214.1 glycosyltransferase [Conexibacter sp. W3-3-2]